jgi:hypothetical protein
MKEEIPYGICQCGCGQKTALAKRTVSAKGMKKDKPNRFIYAHNFKGHNNGKWKGGDYCHNGYSFVRNVAHPRSGSNGYVQEHIVVAERVFGKPLPSGAIVHHSNEKRNDNRSSNLVICQDQAYHQLLHQRMRAYRACGHADWRKCWICKIYDVPANLNIRRPSGSLVFHSKCNNDRNRKYYATHKQ